MQLCRQSDFVSHVRQSFANRDRNRRRYIAHNHRSLRHYVKKVPRRRCPINDRELFTRLAEHLKVLASEAGRAIARTANGEA
jgi:hypothetical protein